MIHIDKNKIYEAHGYKFKNFISLSEDEKIMVLRWRNSPEVRRWMYNRDAIKLEDHLRFIESLAKREDRFYWLAYNEKDIPVGVFNIVNYDRINETAETGSYAKPQSILDSFNFTKAYFYLYFELLGFPKMHSASDSNNANILLFADFWGVKYNREELVNQNGEEVLYKICDCFSIEDYRNKAEVTVRDFIRFIKNNSNK